MLRYLGICNPARRVWRRCFDRVECNGRKWPTGGLFNRTVSNKSHVYGSNWHETLFSRYLGVAGSKSALHRYAYRRIGALQKKTLRHHAGIWHFPTHEWEWVKTAIPKKWFLLGSKPTKMRWKTITSRTSKLRPTPLTKIHTKTCKNH